MSHSYAYEPSGRHYVDCYSREEAEQVVEQCEREGFEAEIYFWGSCHYEVQYWNKGE